MGNLCFMQVDNRYDKFLFEKVKGKEIIKYTIDQICKIKDVRAIVISTYRCKENDVFLTLQEYNSMIKI